MTLDDMLQFGPIVASNSTLGIYVTCSNSLPGESIVLRLFQWVATAEYQCFQTHRDYHNEGGLSMVRAVLLGNILIDRQVKMLAEREELYKELYENKR